MWWWPVRGYRAGCAPDPISILGLERIIQRGNSQKKQPVVRHISRISPLKSPFLLLCSVPTLFPRPVAAAAVPLFIWGVCGRCPVGGRVWGVICRQLGAHLCPSPGMGHSPLLVWDWQLCASPAFPDALKLGIPGTNREGNYTEDLTHFPHLPWLSDPPP